MQLDNTPKSNGLYTQTADFLAALFRDAPDEQYLEYRIFHPGWREQIYTPIAELRANGFISTLPTHYDGQFNVYYGVSPRTRHEGTGKAVDTALAVWFDEWTQPADVPPISWLEETSPGKVQGGYFLDRPTNGPDELRRVERLSQRLIQAVGGDKGVWDRPRILRVPGFLNVKKEHPEHPRAFLLEFNPDLRYSLEELEAALPELAVEDQDRPLREHTGPFNIHMGTPLAEADQERLPQGLQDWG